MSRGWSGALPGGPAAVVAEAQEQWGAMAATSASRGAAWARYLAGAVDALDQLAASLTTEESP